MAHPLLSWALPATAYLSAALILASSAPFGPAGLPPRQAAVTPFATEPVQEPDFEAGLEAAPEAVAGIAERSPEPAPEPVEPTTAALAAWTPLALPAPAEARFGMAALFWLPDEAPSTAMAQLVPLPVRRPAELTRLGAAESLRRAERLAARRSSMAAVAPAEREDTRTFFEKLLGVEKPAAPAPALAYAALENGAAESAARRPLTAPAPALPPAGDGGIAVYDISAQSVVLPSGERLEAHSGLGESMDDPRFVHLKMRGATPPGTYDLTEREAPFHGVRALRLAPVGGSEAIHGRVGLLAHTYLLGPSGASNGCISFKDYDRFLQAYLRGEIRRVVVVAGRGRDTAPLLASR
ncbi:Tlde1 domain-containing protein [Methylorubrum thiocyanatum]